MQTHPPIALAPEALDTESDAAANREWIATALAIAFTTAAVLIASFLAVVTGLA
jgi:hypothetical protein